jgi:polysaccharide pyruvyl transferase WcaK-like protein
MARRSSAAVPRVGMFGHLGGGNIGNDAQLEAVLGYLMTAHPGADIDAMCTAPALVTGRFGIRAVPIHWQRKYEGDRHLGRSRQGSARQGRALPGARTIVLNLVGKGADAVRTMRWVRRHDAVIVPGMGVLEASLPLRPWEMPYSLLLLCAFGRLFGTKVALVGVGASPVKSRTTRWLTDAAAKLAFYRSYRDMPSLEAMSERGIDTTHDHVYPDLAFSLPVPSRNPGDEQTIGVGVMAYYGGNDDRKRADQLHAAYAGQLKSFVRWLADSGYKIRLFIGDAADESMVREILADIQVTRPGLAPEQVAAERVATFAEQLLAMARVGAVVATRYHNIVGALMLAKPTVSVGYAKKNAMLMAEMGLAEFSQDASTFDLELLIKQFTDLMERGPELKPAITACCNAKADHLGRQFAELSAVLLPAAEKTIPSR